MNLPDSERFPSNFFESEDPLSPGACAPEPAGEDEDEDEDEDEHEEDEEEGEDED